MINLAKYWLLNIKSNILPKKYVFCQIRPKKSIDSELTYTLPSTIQWHSTAMSNNCFNATTNYQLTYSNLMSKSYSPYHSFVSTIDSTTSKDPFLISASINEKNKNLNEITQKLTQNSKTNIKDADKEETILNKSNKKNLFFLILSLNNLFC